MARDCDALADAAAAEYFADQAQEIAVAKALEKFVDSLKEWCDRTTPVEVSGYGRTLFRRGVEKYADDLLEFAVQRLELIKQGE